MVPVTTIQIRSQEPVLLVDLSYYIFHRFFATQRWFSFQDKEMIENGHVICDQDVFMNAYKKHMLQDLDKFRKKIAHKTKNPIIFLKDCPRSTIWRNTMIEDYKSNRVLSNKMDVRIFSKTYEWIESELKNTTYLASMEQLEADDLAYLFKELLRKHNPQQEIRIISNDNDYFQLYDSSCIIYNASLKNIKDRCKYGCPAKEKRLKILTGDKSDNIKPCLTVKYKKYLEELLDRSEDSLETFLKEQDSSLVLFQKYTENKSLVDLSCIPSAYQDRFYTTYTISHC
jgi:5'-3' exonuclease